MSKKQEINSKRRICRKKTSEQAFEEWINTIYERGPSLFAAGISYQSAIMAWEAAIEWVKSKK
jgi:hypothetical protein